MKKVLISLLALALAINIGLVGVGCTEPLNGNGDGVPPPVGEDIELDFVTFWPAGDLQAAIGHVNWVRTLEDRVAAETNHTLKINMYYGGTVLGGDVWSEVRDGSYDIGVDGLPYSPSIFPLWEAPTYPGDLYRKNALTMSLTVQALYDEFTPLQDEIAAQNLKLMHLWSTGPYYFFMTPGNEVRTLADFPGKRIRVPLPPARACVEALGAEPIPMPLPFVEAQEKFKAGLLDGMLLVADGPEAFGVAAYVRHATSAPFSYQFVFMKVMNGATWNSLPAEVQAIFDEVNAAWPEYYGKLRAWSEAEGLQYCYRTIPGFTYYDLPSEDPDEYQRWIDATAHLIDDWIGGDAIRQAIWDRFVALDEYYATTEPWSTWTPDASPPPLPTFRHEN
ncbi:MAG: hypothetical protein ACUVTR_06660 [Dehalococcoidia bacterium]